ncbi:MAG: YidC/Oxa1 family membrane protein insertase [Limosilactobacillus pontis]
MSAKQKAAKTPEEQAAVSQQMMALYRDNNISLTGDRLLAITDPVASLCCLYAAIRYSPDLYHATFFGVALGKPSFIFAFYPLSPMLFRATLAWSAFRKNRKTNEDGHLAEPFMTFFISLTSSAGLGLYFFIGGLFAILQTLMVNAYRPRIRKQIAEEAKSTRSRSQKPLLQPSQAPGTQVRPPRSTSLKSQTRLQMAQRNRQRNAGKQQHHKSNK